MSTLVAHMLNAEILITLAVQLALTLESVQQTLVATASTGQDALQAIPFPAVQRAVPNLFTKYPASTSENVASFFGTFTAMLHTQINETQTCWKYMAPLKQTAITCLNGTYTSFMTKAGHILDNTPRMSRSFNSSTVWHSGSGSNPIPPSPAPSWTMTVDDELFRTFRFAYPCVPAPTPWLSGKNIMILLLLLIIFALIMFIRCTYQQMGARTWSFFNGITAQAPQLRKNLLVVGENIVLEKEIDALYFHLERYRQQSLLWDRERQRLEAQVVDLVLQLQHEYMRTGHSEPAAEQERDQEAETSEYDDGDMR